MLCIVHSLHWDMKKCNPDIWQEGGLKVKVKTNATKTSFVVCDKEEKTMHLTNTQSGAVSSGGREWLLNGKGKLYLQQNKW